MNAFSLSRSGGGRSARGTPAPHLAPGGIARVAGIVSAISLVLTCLVAVNLGCALLPELTHWSFH